MKRFLFIISLVALAASGCARKAVVTEPDLTETRANDDIADRPELGTGVNGDAILAVNAGNAAGSRLARILLNGDPTYVLVGNGTLTNTPSFLSIAVEQIINTAPNGSHYGDVGNTVALNPGLATTSGRYAWLNGKMWIADGDDWLTLWLLMNTDIDATPTNGNTAKVPSSDGVFDALAAKATVVASGATALGTSSIASGACAAAVNTGGTATGVVSTDVIDWGFNSDVSGVTGYAPSTNGGLDVKAFPSANDVSFRVCNSTSSSITPGAVTLNWIVLRRNP